ncbi:hypothetical protein MASR2M18_09380 [Ignavibacteria bacterium]|nr:hypothetical protein [Bacteroidota bacterium]MCZ2133301.1 hypothetical protein [Bacteroidota bacterium]
MRITFLIAVVALTAGLGSCKTYMGYDELRHLRKGMSSGEAEKQFELEPASKYNITHKSASYEARRYSMQIGTTQTTASTGGYVGANGVYVPGTTYTSNQANTLGYILLFRDNRLLYWGFLTEFSKSEDPLIVALSDELRSRYYSDKK